jgi:hypothetical protein
MVDIFYCEAVRRIDRSHTMHAALSLASTWINRPMREKLSNLSADPLIFDLQTIRSRRRQLPTPMQWRQAQRGSDQDDSRTADDIGIALTEELLTRPKAAFIPSSFLRLASVRRRQNCARFSLAIKYNGTSARPAGYLVYFPAHAPNGVGACYYHPDRLSRTPITLSVLELSEESGYWHIS